MVMKKAEKSPEIKAVERSWIPDSSPRGHHAEWMALWAQGLFERENKAGRGGALPASVEGC